ncbi:MAG: hypothetical protein B6240_01705 [Desulfobacteraceae bacterium 4572_87]|nr:MAG: hypothetical protein B6240_01705 [Desulfobacteraceae bacterium 4572_87]
MKDERGKYYYPFPQNKKARMYVQETDGMIHFRLWNSDDPKLWEEHDWIPYEAIRQAAEMYDKRSEKKSDFNPNQAYNLDVAKAVLQE